MKRAIKAVALVVALAASAAAAAEHAGRAAESHTTSRTNESYVFDETTTSKKRFDLRVPDAGQRVRLRLRAVLREGEARFHVRDAEGRVRQDVLLRPEGSKPRTYDADTGDLKSPAGQWTVEVELRGARGSYDLTWTAE
jgi:hypothetical protein